MSTAPHEPTITDESADLLAPEERARLATTLLAYAQNRRWFRAKSRRTSGAQVVDLLHLEPTASGPPVVVAMLEVRYEAGEPDLYVMPLAVVDRARAEVLQGDAGYGVVAYMAGGHALVDALVTGEAAEKLLSVARDQRTVAGEVGELRGEASPLLREIAGPSPLAVVIPRAEQSNSTLVFGDRVLFKLYRRLTEGENPELEVGRFLTSHSKTACTPRVLGDLQ